MADRNAFYQAIWAAPDDDLPRMVFADWLDEHDDPDAAAFLRLLSACRTCPPDVDQLRPLVAQLRRVMVKLPPEFIESACPVHPAVVIGPWVDVDHEANRNVLDEVRRLRTTRTGVQPLADVPCEVVQLYWEDLRHSLTPAAACSIDGVPALVDVWSGIVLAVATSRTTCCIRTPAKQVGQKLEESWSRLDTVIGSEWSFSDGSLIEQDWIRDAAAEFDPANQPG